MKNTHNENALVWIDESLKAIGIIEYRFCIENDCYVCDKYGNFYSVCHRQITRAGNLYQKYRVQELTGSIDRDGYVTYRISVNGQKKHLKAHRLMLNAWLGEQPNLCANHKDGDKTNNALSNLEWCTVSENNQHALNTGLKDGTLTRNWKMYRIPCCDWMSIYILNKHRGYSQTLLARMNGCSRPIIHDIIRKIDNIIPEVIRP